MPFLIHSLGDRNYSMWALIGTLTGCYGVIDLGLGAATGRYISRALGRNDLQEINVIANTSLFIYLCLGALVITIAIVVALMTPLFIQNPNEADLMTKALILAGLTLGLQFPVRVAGGILHSYLRYDLIVYAGLVEMVLKLSLIYYFISKGYGLVTLAVITLSVAIVEYTLEFAFMKYTFPSFRIGRKYVDVLKIKELFKYSIIAMTGNTASAMRMQAIPFIVTSYVGVNSVVLFSIGLGLLGYFQQLIENTMAMFVTVFSQLEGQNNLDAIKKGFKYLTVASITISLYVGTSLIVYAEQFISVWLGAKYNQAFYILAIVLIPITMSLVQLPCKQVLLGTSKHSYCAAIYMAELVLVLVCGIVFGWTYGIYGIAFGAALGIIIPELFLPFIMCKALKTNFSQLYGDMIIPSFVKIALVMSCVVLIRNYVTASYSSLVLWNIGQLIVVCPILFAVLPKEIKTLVFATVFPKHIKAMA